MLFDIYALPASRTGRKVDTVTESRVNFLFSQRISPDNQPVCREMWGQIISFGSRDNLIPLFAIN